jgi:hypothetical protein
MTYLMTDEVPKPKLILKQPKRDVRISNDWMGLLNKKSKAAKKAAATKKPASKKVAR